MKTALLSGLGKYRDFGFLALRLGLGVMLVFHGYPRLFAGPARWGQLGSGVSLPGLPPAPQVWGFLAALCLFGGGILLILGLFFRLAAVGLLVTLAAAAAFHWQTPAGPLSASPWLEGAVTAFALLFLGPGRHSLDGS